MSYNVVVEKTKKFITPGEDDRTVHHKKVVKKRTIDATVTHKQGKQTKPQVERYEFHKK